jgi:hypothetical protein
MERAAFSVASFLPFWRWAVALEERPDLPAVPFYRKASALAFADESVDRFPQRTTIVLKRVWGAVVVDYARRGDGR